METKKVASIEVTDKSKSSEPTTETDPTLAVQDDDDEDLAAPPAAKRPRTEELN